MCYLCRNIKLESIKCDCKCEKRIKINSVYEICINCNHKHLIYLYDYLIKESD